VEKIVLLPVIEFIIADTSFFLIFTIDRLVERFYIYVELKPTYYEFL